MRSSDTLMYNDEAYTCCIQDEDDLGFKGFRLAKVEKEALTINIRVLLPEVLLKWEIFRYSLVSYYTSKVI